MKIPDSVEEIGNFAFQDCKSITTIYLGSGIKKIGSFCFDGCTKFRHIFYHGTIEQWDKIDLGENAFPETASIHFKE